ncbi:hypothetical protein HID58_043718 [Brassica napus]|uniref:Uncharacterized protein n=1 Tax=Brassica napus TaxID=3708 RepID=A0ABQ8BHE1_BRANA|nr:hypothetical protein HID58_043718 [Brassica napus]
MFGQFKINHLDSSGEASASAVKKWKTGRRRMKIEVEDEVKHRFRKSPLYILIPAKPTPKPHQVWKPKPKSATKQNDATASVSATSRTCKHDKEDIKAPNAKGLKAASIKANTSSQTAHVIATANRFQTLCDELAETS